MSRWVVSCKPGLTGFVKVVLLVLNSDLKKLGREPRQEDASWVVNISF